MNSFIVWNRVLEKQVVLQLVKKLMNSMESKALDHVH